MSVEKVFDEEGVFDDKCAKCCRGCCCAPPPFRVALVPVILLLAIFIVLYVLFAFDYTGLCADSDQKPAQCPMVNRTLNGTTEIVEKCPENDLCYFLTVAKVSVRDWSLFFIIAIAGFAIIRAIVSIAWWIVRAVSGKNGVIWAYVKPNDTPVHWFVWNFLFFIIYNTFLFDAEALVYFVCDALAKMITIFTIVIVVANLCTVFVKRMFSAKTRKTAAKYRAKAKLVDKVVANSSSSLVNTLSFGLSKIGKKALKNTSKTVRAAKTGDDVVVEMDVKKTELSDDDLQESWKKIAGKKANLRKDDLAKYADVSGGLAKDLWAIFSEEPKGEINFNQFVNGIRDVERGLRDALNELENRKFLGDIAGTLVFAIFIIIGVIIALDSIELDLAMLVTALSVLSVAAGMVLSGIFGQVLTSFIFLLTTKAYYVGDVVIIGGEALIVKKITLFCTYGFTPDGKWVVYQNHVLASMKLSNNARAIDSVFVIEATINPATTQKQLDTFEATLQKYIADRPQVFKGMSMGLDRIDAVENKFVVVIKAFCRGITWGRYDLWYPARCEFTNFIRKTASQLGIHYVRAIQPMATVPLPAVEDEEPIELVEPTPKEDEKAATVFDDDSSSSSSSSSSAEERKKKKRKSKKSEK